MEAEASPLAAARFAACPSPAGIEPGLRISSAAPAPSRLPADEMNSSCADSLGRHVAITGDAFEDEDPHPCLQA
jgi:hypothetical protein